MRGNDGVKTSVGRLRFFPVALAVTAAVVVGRAAAVSASNGCTRLELPVEEVSAPPVQYTDFCRRYPSDCEMTGEARIEWTQATRRLVRNVNRTVNHEIRLLPDPELWGEEERWDYPLGGMGDCEDIALEKRRRLVAQGLPRAAMTMAIAHHRTRFFPHALLLLETDQGTFVLNNLTDEILCWDEIPYSFEARERPDGRWNRFDRSHPNECGG